jgi:hypothetical protein
VQTKTGIGVNRNYLRDCLEAFKELPKRSTAPLRILRQSSWPLLLFEIEDR